MFGEYSFKRMGYLYSFSIMHHLVGYPRIKISISGTRKCMQGPLHNLKPQGFDERRVLDNLNECGGKLTKQLPCYLRSERDHIAN